MGQTTTRTGIAEMTKDEAVDIIAQFMKRHALRFSEGRYPDSMRQNGDPAHLGFVGVVIDRKALDGESEKFVQALAILKGST